MPYSKRKFDVGVCMAPMFYFERWDIMVVLLEVYHYFGAELQIFYIMSVLDDIYRLIEVSSKSYPKWFYHWENRKDDALTKNSRYTKNGVFSRWNCGPHWRASGASTVSLVVGNYGGGIRPQLIPIAS